MIVHAGTALRLCEHILHIRIEIGHFTYSSHISRIYFVICLDIFLYFTIVLSFSTLDDIEID